MTEKVPEKAQDTHPPVPEFDPIKAHMDSLRGVFQRFRVGEATMGDRAHAAGSLHELQRLLLGGNRMLDLLLHGLNHALFLLQFPKDEVKVCLQALTDLDSLEREVRPKTRGALDEISTCWRADLGVFTEFKFEGKTYRQQWPTHEAAKQAMCLLNEVADGRWNGPPGSAKATENHQPLPGYGRNQPRPWTLDGALVVLRGISQDPELTAAQREEASGAVCFLQRQLDVEACLSKDATEELEHVRKHGEPLCREDKRVLSLYSCTTIEEVLAVLRGIHEHLPDRAKPYAKMALEDLEKLLEKKVTKSFDREGPPAKNHCRSFFNVEGTTLWEYRLFTNGTYDVVPAATKAVPLGSATGSWWVVEKG